jgi:hypothetical protein
VNVMGAAINCYSAPQPTHLKRVLMEPDRRRDGAGDGWPSITTVARDSSIRARGDAAGLVLRLLIIFFMNDPRGGECEEMT